MYVWGRETDTCGTSRSMLDGMSMSPTAAIHGPSLGAPSCWSAQLRCCAAGSTRQCLHSSRRRARSCMTSSSSSGASSASPGARTPCAALQKKTWSCAAVAAVAPQQQAPPGQAQTASAAALRKAQLATPPSGAVRTQIWSSAYARKPSVLKSSSRLLLPSSAATSAMMRVARFAAGAAGSRAPPLLAAVRPQIAVQGTSTGQRFKTRVHAQQGGSGMGSSLHTTPVACAACRRDRTCRERAQTHGRGRILGDTLDHICTS